MATIDQRKIITISYVNDQGILDTCTILPLGIDFSSTVQHIEPQWVLDAFDVNKQERLAIPLKDVAAWGTGNWRQ